MVRKLVKTTEIEVDDRRYAVSYYQHRTTRGIQRFSVEVQLSPEDHIILDDDSLTSLESKVARLVPALIDSRMMAGPWAVA